MGGASYHLMLSPRDRLNHMTRTGLKLWKVQFAPYHQGRQLKITEPGMSLFPLVLFPQRHSTKGCTIDLKKQCPMFSPDPAWRGCGAVQPEVSFQRIHLINASGFFSRVNLFD